MNKIQIIFRFLFSVSVLPFASASPEAERVYRAGAEAVLAATLIVFLFSYLDLNRLRIHYSQIAMVWLIFLASHIPLFAAWGGILGASWTGARDGVRNLRIESGKIKSNKPLARRGQKKIGEDEC